MYHEMLGLDETIALARGLHDLLPQNIPVECREGHIVIYNPQLVKTILASDPTFYGQDIRDVDE